RHGFNTKPFAIDMATGAFGPAPATVGARLDVHQFDVRFPSGKVTLAGTLTIPPGDRPHPAVVYVSGSGDTLREESHWLDSLFVSRGIAVLAYDKRGVGQSGGSYPGDLATDETIAALALGPGGYDPVAWSRRPAIPVLWLYGGEDRNQPAGTSMEILRGLSAGHDFTTALFPNAPHSLFDQRGFPPDLFATSTDWLKQ